MDALAFLPAHELARRLRRRDVSSVELLQHYLQRGERLGPKINALPVLDAERAMDRAREADAACPRPSGTRPFAPAGPTPMQRRSRA